MTCPDCKVEMTKYFVASSEKWSLITDYYKCPKCGIEAVDNENSDEDSDDDNGNWVHDHDMEARG